MYKFENSNQALIGMSLALTEEGVWRDVRGYRCLEIPHPVMIEISNPADRYITIPDRKWNKYLPFAESLWIALGLNDLNSLPGHYVKSLYDYSDDGRTWRAGYGPRVRAFNGIVDDYDISDPKHRDFVYYDSTITVVDQLRYVIDSFHRDMGTRQAIISIGDPAKDCFDLDGDLKITKDYPCSRTIHFMIVDGKLNCTLYIRSNDILFGMSGVNIFNFTWMLEYVANMIGVPVGKYYHVANNLHVYKEHFDKIYEFSRLEQFRYRTRFPFKYRESQFVSLTAFDDLIGVLYSYQQKLVAGADPGLFDVKNDMINDWAKVFLHFEKKENLEFVNPHLNKLFNK